MSKLLLSHQEYLEAFVKTAQYLAGLTIQQDIWRDMEQLLSRFFGVDVVGFVEPGQDNASIEATSEFFGPLSSETILNDEIRDVIHDVFETGFLALKIIHVPEPYSFAFLPLTQENKPRTVMLVGHNTPTALPKELLALYLAVAGLVSTTITRHFSEIELKKYRVHLEETVKIRTLELSEANLGLKSEICERTLMEEALRKASYQNEVILNTAGEGICGTDSEGKIMFANPAAAKMCGYQVEELIGAQMHSLLHYAKPDGSPYPREECPHFITLSKGTAVNMTEEIFWRKDGTSFPIAYTSTPILEGETIAGVVVTFRDITERRQTEELMQVRMRLLEFAGKHTIEELLRKILDEVGKLVDSPIGFYHFVEPDQKTLSLQAWSTLTLDKFCKAEGKGMHYSIEKAGVWADCLRQRKPVIHNDYASVPNCKGMPEGHANVTRELIVPIFRTDRIVAILGVGNRPQDYTEKDVKIVQYLADIGWEITSRKRAEAEKAELILESYTREMELMKYREKYSISQQENAFVKELNIVKDDLFLTKIDVVTNRGEAVEWVIDLYYKPLDIMSGDSYSIREIEEGKILVYLADAMGKGLAASVTSILSTAFVNHLVNEAKDGSGFDFREFIDTYSKIIRRELIEEEILCVKFIFFDLVNETMDAVICSMPPALCQTVDNKIVRIENNNMPLMIYPAEIRIDRYDISNFRKILAHTDGLNESFRTEDSIYQEYLEEDFRESEFGNHLMGRFNNAIKKPDDDVSFVFLRRISRNPKWTKVLTIAARLSEVMAAAGKVEEFLDMLGANAEFKVMFINAFNEIVVNAYEHGSLNIDQEQKGRLVQDDAYHDYLLRAEKEVTKRIDVTLSLHELNGNDYLMLTVTDEGEGFDTSLLGKNRMECDNPAISGRGVQMAKCLTDELFYNRAGNQVTVLKMISTSVHKSGPECNRIYELNY